MHRHRHRDKDSTEMRVGIFLVRIFQHTTLLIAFVWQRVKHDSRIANVKLVSGACNTIHATSLHALTLCTIHICKAAPAMQFHKTMH